MENLTYKPHLLGDPIISHYKEEYHRVMDTIASYDTKFLSQQYLPISALFIALIAISDSDIISLFFPLFLLYYYLNSAKYLLKMSEYGGYARFLEGRLNEILGVDVYLEKATFSNVPGRSFLTRNIVHIFNGSILFFALVFFIRDFPDIYNNSTKGIQDLLVLLTFFYICLFIFLIYMLSIIGQVNGKVFLHLSQEKSVTDTPLTYHK